MEIDGEIEMIIRALAVIAFTFLLAGCSRAVLFNNGLFSHTVEPLTFNREPTNMANGREPARGQIDQMQSPLHAALSVRLGKNGLADVAKESGITTIYYADLERWSIVFGLWSREIVHIYGR
jgi:hypothetical protein